MEFRPTSDLTAVTPEAERDAAMRVLDRTNLTADDRGLIAEALGLLEYVGYDSRSRTSKAKVAVIRVPGETPPETATTDPYGRFIASSVLRGRRLA